MNKGRLEAFSDGVIAIIITIMVFNIEAPTVGTFRALNSVAPAVLSYLMSFVYLGIYWNNHHHMLQITDRINGTVLWANLHLLFWLSLMPFATSWLQQTGFDRLPMAAYGVVLLCAGVAYRLLQSSIIRVQGPGSKLSQAVGRDWKGTLSLFAYAIAVGIAHKTPWMSLAIYIAIAILWLVPDKRIESAL